MLHRTFRKRTQETVNSGGLLGKNQGLRYGNKFLALRWHHSCHRSANQNVANILYYKCSALPETKHVQSANPRTPNQLLFTYFLAPYSFPIKAFYL